MGVNPAPVAPLPAPTQLSSGPDRRSNGIFDLYYARPQSTSGGVPSEADDIVSYSTAGEPGPFPVPHVNTKQDEYDPAVEGTSGTTLAFARSASAERQTIYLRTLGTESLYVKPAGRPVVRVAHASISDSGGTDHSFGRPVVSGRYVFSSFSTRKGDDGATSYVLLRTTIATGRTVASPLADEDDYRTIDPRSEGAGLGFRFGPPPAAAHAR